MITTLLAVGLMAILFLYLPIFVGFLVGALIGIVYYFIAKYPKEKKEKEEERRKIAEIQNRWKDFKDW